MITHEPSLDARQREAQTNSNHKTEQQGQHQDHFGHKIRKKKANTMRILMCNPNGLTGTGRPSKINRIKYKSISYQVDALCIVEHGQNLKRTPVLHNLKHTTQGWWQHRRICQAYNKHFDSGKASQVGGVSIILNNSLAHRSTIPQHDPTGLGRWTSILINGKQNFATRIICAYRPCKSSGPETAYMQHALHFHRINKKSDPRKLFMDDLATAILQWQKEGEKIILVGDFNTGDKTTNRSQQQFWQKWLQTTNLREAHRIFTNEEVLPSTHERGKVQIDYMFVSPGLSVRRAGFLPFAKFPGDHRALWMDIDAKEIIGYKPPPLSMATARRLKLQDPRIVKRYITDLKQRLISNNVLDRLQFLSLISPTTWSTQHTEEYERISIEFRASMLKAETRCRKFQTGSHPWSPQLDIARKTKFYWDLTVKKLSGLKVPTRKLLKLYKQLNLSSKSETMQSALDSQQIAHREYRRIKRKSRHYRITFRENLAMAIADHKQTSEKAVLRELINREETREMYRKLKRMRHKYTSLSTSGVLVTNTNGKKKLVTDKDMLEQVIMEENEKKFHQTEDHCPLMKGQLLEDIGLYANGPRVSDILSGNYKPPSGTGSATKIFLKACQQPATFSATQYDYTSKEHYIKAWSKAKEKTGSGQVHFGHWKAGLYDQDITNAEWLLTFLPTHHGFSPKIWQQATDVMILKKSGVLDLDKLRTIVLYEADFNFVNKCLGRKVMDNAMANNCMAQEQYARPGCSAQEQCLTRRLIFDLVRHTRQSLAMASSDLKSCYDRIVHNAASLAMQKCGISKEAVSVMFQTIQQCQHKIRTAYGDSTKTYGGKGKYDSPPMGAGQGNGAGPQMWAVLSATLFMAMHLEGLSTQFCQKMTEKVISLIGFMYVDDMDLIRICDDIDSAHLTEDLQLTLAYWNRLVRVTGGALEPSKSGWYAFRQKWNDKTGQYEYEDIGKKDDIKTRDKDGKNVSLPFISCNKAQEMIGVKMTPTGDQTEQIKEMYKKAKEEARYLQEGNISETETKHAVTACIYPRLAWPLTCMSITQKQGKQLLRPIVAAALPKMGIVSTLGYDYVHGSSEFQGLGIPELYHSTYSKQLEIVIDHLWKNTQTGHFIMTALQEFVIETGSTQHPFKPIHKSRLKHWIITPNTWVAAIQEYVLQHNITVNINIPLLTPLRQNDVTIMDILDQSPQFSSMQLRDINIVRIYKKVTFLSDIATGDGIRLSDMAWSDTPNTRNTTHPFNRQDYPNQKQWSSWFSALRYINQNESNRLLCPPLGRWLVDDHEYIEQWDYFYDMRRRCLLQNTSDSLWLEYPILPNKTRNLYFSRSGNYVPAPRHKDTLRRTTIRRMSTEVRCEGFRENIKPSPQLNDSLPTTTLDIALLKSLSKKFEDSTWALKNIETSPTITTLLQDFAQGKSIMVGDGSYEDSLGFGAGACILSSADGKEFIIAGGPTPGPSNQQNAYRSELGTIVSMGILSHIVAQYTNSSPSIVVACDNDAALERPFLPRTFLSSSQKSADLISLAHDIWQQSPASAIPTKVKGHADEQNRQLTLLEKLNCIVDSKAKQFLSTRKMIEIQRTGDLDFGCACISINGTNVTGKIANEIQATQALQRSKAAGLRNNRFTERTWDLIDRRALSRSSSNMSTYKKNFVTKWTSGQLPVGSNLTQRRHRLFDTCPMCQNAREDMAHMIHCQSEVAIDTHRTALESFSKWLKDADTDPVIHHHLIAVLSILRLYPNTTHLPYPCSITKHAYYEVFKEQGTIGWQQFTEGLISKKWALLQQSHYNTIHSNKTGMAWASNVISRLWETNLLIWTNRNLQLHSNSSFLNYLHGKEYLDVAIQKEFCIGKGNLPQTFSPFFLNKTLHELMESTVETKIKWFKHIRTAREDNGSDIHDEFSYNQALRNWVGLRQK
jgi:exonuclease III